ncbi:hypothetical protein TRVL_10089 [Trypanosoma vivax]|nr:hypothetical protein TRVL_10089 [Trypanosoma vivax]
MERCGPWSGPQIRPQTLSGSGKVTLNNTKASSYPLRGKRVWLRALCVADAFVPIPNQSEREFLAEINGTPLSEPLGSVMGQRKRTKGGAKPTKHRENKR